MPTACWGALKTARVTCGSLDGTVAPTAATLLALGEVAGLSLVRKPVILALTVLTILAALALVMSLLGYRTMLGGDAEAAIRAPRVLPDGVVGDAAAMLPPPPPSLMPTAACIVGVMLGGDAHSCIKAPAAEPCSSPSFSST